MATREKIPNTQPVTCNQLLITPLRRDFIRFPYPQISHRISWYSEVRPPIL